MAHPISEKIIGLHVGTFHIPEWIIREHPQALLDFFHREGVLPIESKMDCFCSPGVHYTAFGMTFDEVPMGRIPYHYMVDTVTEASAPDETGKTTITITSMSFRRFN